MALPGFIRRGCVSRVTTSSRGEERERAGVSKRDRFVRAPVLLSSLAGLAPKMKDIAQGSGELFKGTTIRDIYDKVKIVLREDAQAQAQHGRGDSETSKRHGGLGNRISDVGPCNRGFGRPPNRGGYAVQPGLVPVPVLDDYEGDPDVQDSDAAASGAAAAEPCRRIVVTHRLPLRADPNPDARYGLDFSFDDDALPLQFCRGLPHPIFVGALPSAAMWIPDSDDLVADFLERFSCIPVFLGDTYFYDVFCEEYLRPRLHSLRPLTPSSGGGCVSYSAEHYGAFQTVNSHFADRVFEHLNPEEDLVYIHDYHLWALPTILRQKSPRARIGFFLHAPFPTLDLFRAIPVREDLLRALLNADLVGFQSYNHARHFLSCCDKFLGISHQRLHGQIGIDYLGRLVSVTARSFSVDMGKLRELLSSQETAAKALEIANKYAGHRILLSVAADVDEGTCIELLAMEKLLVSRPELRGTMVLVQINNSARSPEQYTLRTKLLQIRDCINERFRLPGYDPIVIIDDPLRMQDRMAFYIVADICIVASVHDSLNRIPDVYTICRQESPIIPRDVPRDGAIIVSEFVSYSPSLSCAIRVNQWIMNDVTEAMSLAVGMNNRDRRIGQNTHYMQLKSHDAAHWASLLDQDLQRACKDRVSTNILSVGQAMNFQVVALGPDCQKLLPEHINPPYHRTMSRLILLDYDGIVTPQGLIFRAPKHDLIGTLSVLCSDPNNTVFVVSGESKDALAEWFAPCQNLGILAEHGYYRRWPGGTTWEEHKFKNLHFRNVARLAMKPFTDATNGSYIEVNENAIVWHYEEADPDFGASQAKELYDLLLSLNLNVLAKEPVSVQNRHHTVEVIPPGGVGKGIAVKTLVAAMKDHGSVPDFILCVGDDKSDMFEAITAPLSNSAEIFACTVGRKPNLANYFLGDLTDVVKMLKGLTEGS